MSVETVASTEPSVGRNMAMFARDSDHGGDRGILRPSGSSTTQEIDGCSWAKTFSPSGPAPLYAASGPSGDPHDEVFLELTVPYRSSCAKCSCVAPGLSPLEPIDPVERWTENTGSTD